MLKEDLKRLLKKYKSIEDFYIFGSFVKGKFKPSDIDIALIIHEKDFALLSNVMKEIKYPDIHIEMFLFKEIFTEPVWKSLLSEGFSVKKNKFLRDLIGVKSGILYKYSLKKMNRSEKTMFNRAFSLLIKSIKGEHISAGSVIIPIEKESEFDDFLKVWEKVDKKKFRILIL